MIWSHTIIVMKLAILHTIHVSAQVAGVASSSTILNARDRSADEDCIINSTSLKSLTAFQTQLAYGNQTNGDDNVIEFRLYNPAIDVSTECSGHGAALNGSDASAPYWCFVESRDPRITATFQFDATTNKLSVNETWVCDVVGGGQS